MTEARATGRAAVAARLLPALILLTAILWQGGFFPIQYLPVAAGLLLCLLLRRDSIVATPGLLLLAGIPLAMLPGLFLAEDTRTGLLEWLRHSLLPLACWVFCGGKNRQWAGRALYGGCVVSAALGLLSWIGLLSLAGGVLQPGNRLQSVFQYANTAALFSGLGILLGLDALRTTRKWLHLIPCAVCLIAMVLTGSRTVFLLFLAVAALWLLRAGSGKIRLLLLGAAILLLLGLAAAGSRLLRLSLLEPSLIERLITFQDALGLLRGRLLPGIGAGNWQAWQFRYQSAPYTAAYIHSFLLQLLLDGGVLPALLLLGALLTALVRGWRRHSIHFFLLLLLFSASLLDFHLAYGGTALAAALSLAELQPDNGRARKPGKLRWLLLLPLASLALLWLSELQLLRSTALLAEGKPEQAMAAAGSSLTWNPRNGAAYTILAMAESNDDRAVALLQRAQERNPNDFDARQELVRRLAARGQLARAQKEMEWLLEARPFHEAYRAQYSALLARSQRLGLLPPEEAEEKRREAEKRPEPNPLYVKYIQSNGKRSES